MGLFAYIISYEAQNSRGRQEMQGLNYPLFTDKKVEAQHIP